MSDSTLWYMAHPVAGDAKANAARALRWLAWLRRHEPDAIICAPWLASLLSGDDDSDPAVRARAIRECAAIASVFDGIILVGGCTSSGMQRELDVIALDGGVVCDLTALGNEPPSDDDLKALFAQAGADPHFGFLAPASVLELGAHYWEAT